jgi:hypothetical protein
MIHTLQLAPPKLDNYRELPDIDLIQESFKDRRLDMLQKIGEQILSS